MLGCPRVESPISSLGRPSTPPLPRNRDGALQRLVADAVEPVTSWTSALGLLKEMTCHPVYGPHRRLLASARDRGPGVARLMVNAVHGSLPQPKCDQFATQAVHLERSRQPTERYVEPSPEGLQLVAASRVSFPETGLRETTMRSVRLLPEHQATGCMRSTRTCGTSAVARRCL
jgi:hypothetical protein